MTAFYVCIEETEADALLSARECGVSGARLVEVDPFKEGRGAASAAAEMACTERDDGMSDRSDGDSFGAAVWPVGSDPQKADISLFTLEFQVLIQYVATPVALGEGDWVNCSYCLGGRVAPQKVGYVGPPMCEACLGRRLDEQD